MSTLTETQERPPGRDLALDTVHSHVGFEIGYAAGTFRGSFSPFEASLVVDEGGARRAVGAASVDSVHVQDENLTAHLLVAGLLRRRAHPALRFESTTIRRDGDDLDDRAAS